MEVCNRDGRRKCKTWEVIRASHTDEKEQRNLNGGRDLGSLGGFLVLKLYEY